MIKILTVDDIANSLSARDERYSLPGVYALAEFLDSNSPEYKEFDVIEIWSSFSEYSSAVEAVSDLGMREDAYENSDTNTTDAELEEIALLYLADNFIVIEFNGGIIVGM